MREYVKKIIQTTSSKNEPLALELVEAIGTSLGYAPLPNPALFYLTHLASGAMLSQESEEHMTNVYVEGEEVARAWIEELTKIADWSKEPDQLFEDTPRHVLLARVQRAIPDAYEVVNSQDVEDYSRFVATALYPLPQREATTV